MNHLESLCMYVCIYHLTHALSYSKKDLKHQKIYLNVIITTVVTAAWPHTALLGAWFVHQRQLGSDRNTRWKWGRGQQVAESGHWGFSPSSGPSGQCDLGQVLSYFWAAVDVSSSYTEGIESTFCLITKLLVRTGYRICGAWCKIKMSGPLFKTLKNSRWWQRSIKSRAGPSKHKTLCDCTGRWPMNQALQLLPIKFDGKPTWAAFGLSTFHGSLWYFWRSFGSREQSWKNTN